MAPYTVIARKFRPICFSEVLGQDITVTILKNAIIQKRIGHAYLFCGVRGTGKTTLARLFAKALNCLNLSSSQEPCNECSFCKEITAGSSIDVLEIDGASHRGIDDIRQINETIGYSAASGKYKIYIIDEVHMLTKEAFNALLKTLEEPPPHVKFIFATTEPHKIPPTILSRCQRFNLNRIPAQLIVAKLQTITQALGRGAEQAALYAIAELAEGSLRDAESLLDRLFTFYEGSISEENVADACGIVTRKVLFSLDKAGAENDLAKAFEIGHKLFSEGKDIVYFIDSLLTHFRTILLIKLASGNTPFFSELPENEREEYRRSAALYKSEQCLYILDFLIEAQGEIRAATSVQIALEVLLLRILRSHQRIPVEYLVKKLAELEPLAAAETKSAAPPDVTSSSPSDSELKIEQEYEANHRVEKESSNKEEEDSMDNRPASQPVSRPAAADKSAAALPSSEAVSEPAKTTSPFSSRYETLLQFAAVELEGRIEKDRPIIS